MNREKYCLNPYLKFVLCNEDELLIKHGTRSFFSMILKDDKKTKLLGKIYKNFRSPIPLDDFISSHAIGKIKQDETINLINTLYSEHN